MLKGLDVEANPMESAMSGLLETVYEDESLVVVNKPTGMLSIPGKGEQPSVYSILRERYPDAEEPMIVHRLDMATSGLLVVAKTKNAHQNLQRQFYEHTVVKRYIAIVEGVPVNQKGTIVLPMRPDPLNRPYQVVDMEHGKQAITDFEVLSVSDGQSRVVLYPHTGRTHQLRVHCAHPDGLHAPIVGDHLYGTPANRLYLHAEYLEFTHPVNDKRLQFYAEGF
jgi:tRNA pseudouridine32 synthase/23S rRNA pseudouridine746 synthase